MTAVTSQAAPEAEIRELLNDWADAIRTKDLDRLMATYAPDVVAFDLVPPLRFVGAEAYRRIWQEWFPTHRGPIEYEIRDLRITAGADVGFAHSLNWIRGTNRNGKDWGIWVRSTIGFRRIGGRWLVTHEHASLPFDMESTRTLVDLDG